MMPTREDRIRQEAYLKGVEEQQTMIDGLMAMHEGVQGRLNQLVQTAEETIQALEAAPYPQDYRDFLTSLVGVRESLLQAVNLANGNGQEKPVAEA